MNAALVSPPRSKVTAEQLSEEVAEYFTLGAHVAPGVREHSVRVETLAILVYARRKPEPRCAASLATRATMPRHRRAPAPSASSKW